MESKKAEYIEYGGYKYHVFMFFIFADLLDSAMRSVSPPSKSR